MIDVNQGVNPVINYIGNMNTPIVIVDNFSLNPQEIRSHACTLARYQPDESTYYPGVRALLPKQVVVDYLAPILKGLCSIYAIPEHLKPAPKNSYFSLITTQPDDLLLVQSIPHVDTVSPYVFAVLHYIDEGHHGGTGFFRHIPTGFERLTAENESQYCEETNRYMGSHTAPTGYCGNNSDLYELYYQIEYRPNRLVIYPGNLLHSVVVDETNDISADPTNGRLTANLFVEFR